ncbi:MAG: hypothetical protein ACYSO4_06375 [Planctomycetota bacterium]
MDYKRMAFVGSLSLPLIAIILVGISLNYLWQIDAFAMAFYVMSLCLASSALGKNYIYRLAISSIIFFVGFLYSDFWPAVQIAFAVGYATIFATGVVPTKWSKKCWLIFPYSIIRLAAVWFCMHLIPFDFIDGDLFDKNIIGLLGFTYSVIILLLLLDVLFKKITFRMFTRDH